MTLEEKIRVQFSLYNDGKIDVFQLIALINETLSFFGKDGFNKNGYNRIYQELFYYKNLSYKDGIEAIQEIFSSPNKENPFKENQN